MAAAAAALLRAHEFGSVRINLTQSAACIFTWGLPRASETPAHGMSLSTGNGHTPCTPVFA